MSRCKYFNECGKKDSIARTLIEACGWKDMTCICSDYKPGHPELDPYWKDIIDETNRRLSNAN